MKLLKSHPKHLVLMGLLIISTSALAEEVPFPSRSSDLPVDSYWSVSSLHPGNARDLNVARRTDGGWSTLDTDGGPLNSDRNSFGVPLYAPIDGEVISCWRNHPENPQPGSVHIERCCGGDCDIACDDAACPQTESCRITRSGNHMAIRGADGDAILLAHLQSGTVPPSLCPYSDAFMNDSRDKPGDEYPRESQLRLCQAGESPAMDACFLQRPRVRRGDFIGQSGNSGASSGPHTHLHTLGVAENANGFFERTSNTKPFKFAYGWQMKRATSTEWQQLIGNDTVLDDQDLIHPSPYLRRAEESAEPVTETSSTYHTPVGRLVTAAITESDSLLQLTTWDTVGTSTINRRSETTEGIVKDVRIVGRLSFNSAVVAVRQDDNSLKLIRYHTLPAGELHRVSDITGPRILALDLVALDSDIVVTAVRDASGILRISTWRLPFADPNGIESVAEAIEDPVVSTGTTLAMTRARNFRGVVTAVRDPDGTLRIIPWRISDDGEQITRGNSATAVPVGADLDVAALAGGVAVAAQDSFGNLRLITWRINQEGNVVALRETASAGPASEIQLLAMPRGGSNLTSVLRDGDGALQVIGWRVNHFGGGLRRIGSSKAGVASAISADSQFRFGQDSGDALITTVREESGEMKLIFWEVNLKNP